jgi:hypothetical protein
MTYTVNGEQSVAVYAGGNGIVTFVDPAVKPDGGASLHVFKLRG